MTGSSKTILVVDDEPASRYTVGKMLQRACYVVKEAATGREALLLAAEKPDLIILDIGLPDVSGYDVCKSIKGNPKTAAIPVLHVSATFAESENRVRGLEGGADGYLTYPLNPSELIANVQSLLRMREAERQAREQRELLRVTLSSIGEGVIATDISGRVTFINPIAQHLTGWHAETATGRLLEEVFRIADLASGKEADNPVGHVIREGLPIALTNQMLLTAQGAAGRPIDFTATPIRDDQGNSMGAVVVFRDISERHVAEQRQATQFAVTRILAESATVEEAIPQLLQGMGEGLGWEIGQIWLREPGAADDSCCGVWSSMDETVSGVEHTLGFTPLLPDDALRRRVWASCEPICITMGQKSDDLFPSSAAQAGIHTALAFPIHSGREVLGIAEFFSRQVVQPTDVLVVLAANVGRQIGQFIARKRAETAFRKSDEMFRAIFDNTMAVVYVIDPEGRFLLINRRFRDLFQLSDEQVCGRTLEDFFPRELADAFRENNRKVVEARSALEFEESAPHPDGVHTYVSIKVPLLDAHGVPYAICGVSTDITEHKRLTQVLRQQAEELAEQSRRKDEFLAMLAHELRNPLAPVRNAAQIIRLAGGKNPAIDQAGEMIERQVQHMTRLIEDLLDVSRVSRGIVQLRWEEVDLATIIARAIESVQPLVGSRNHELILTLPNRPVRMQGDVTRLVQVVSNLLNNAAKYTEPGGRIWLTAVHHGGEVEIRVKDTGIGIAPEELPRVFEMFTQVDRSSERSQGGLGIGLTLVKSLVEIHSGTISAHSEGPRCGSEFVVRLPTLGEGVAAEREQIQGGLTHRITTTARRRVLIVDDHVDSAVSLAMLLQLQRHEVHVVHEGLRAMEAIRSYRPELVFLDIGLPGMDGYEIARRIRQEFQPDEIVVVAMTGYGQEDDRLRSQEAGFNAHLTKPVALQDLQIFLDCIEVTGQRPAAE